MKTNYYVIILIITFNGLCLHAENISEAKYDSLAMRFYNYEMKSSYDSLAISSFKNQNILRSFTHMHEYSILQDNNNITYIKKILVLVDDYIYDEIPTLIIRYAHDIHNAFGCSVDIVSVSGGTPAQIKSIIQSYSNNLSGAVFVGYIAPAYYYNASTSTGSTNWYEDYYPCDLFYMDLDGNWSLKSGHFDWYDNHTGNVKPEIFVGRINTSSMPIDEIEELIYYLERNHKYWAGKKTLNKQRALTFTGPDWDESSFWNSVAPLYGNSHYDAVKAIDFYRNNYISYLQNSNYEFIQLASHSMYKYHFFEADNDTLYNDVIASITKKTIGYNLFCCHACNWMSSFSEQCLGESYLYCGANDSEALAVVGSTKSGGMLGFSDFYIPLGNGKCIGEALRLWWVNHCGNNHSLSEKLWFYGMCILGDPLVDFNFSNTCDNILTLNSGEESNNAMYYAQDKIVVQNYSITQSQDVTLSAPTVHIKGPFRCSSPATFKTNVTDRCVCNTSNRAQSHVLSNYSQEVQIANSFPNYKLLSIYPNPTTNFINIDSQLSISSINIYNLSGQCVLKTKETTINVSQLPEGIYILQAVTADGQVLQDKFIRTK